MLDQFECQTPYLMEIEKGSEAFIIGSFFLPNISHILTKSFDWKRLRANSKFLCVLDSTAEFGAMYKPRGQNLGTHLPFYWIPGFLATPSPCLPVPPRASPSPLICLRGLYTPPLVHFYWSSLHSIQRPSIKALKWVCGTYTVHSTLLGHP